MGTVIKAIQSSDLPVWDAYVHAHGQATIYHLSGWKNVIEKTYSHKTYYLMAIKNELSAMSHPCPVKREACFTGELSVDQVVGILPLVHLKHFLFGNTLISIPFFDLGGILADNKDAEKALLAEAMALGGELNADKIELRHTHPFSWLGSNSSTHPAISHQPSAAKWLSQTRAHKVRMVLDLPESSEMLMKSFKSKLRSQIKKPLKEGLKSKIGGLELLDDFYEVFSTNMRDLGSPVHSKKLTKHVLEEFPKNAKIVMVYGDSQAMACSVVAGFKDTLENPWASSLREFSRLSPNMLLYWRMLEYACANGFKYFDFGRSSPDEGTYRFKEQWGTQPIPLNRQYLPLNAEKLDQEKAQKAKFEKAIQFWQKLPVAVTKIIGPLIRKHIGL